MNTLSLKFYPSIYLMFKIMLCALGYVSTLFWIISMKWELPANSHKRGRENFWKLKFQAYIFSLFHKTSSDVYREHIISFSLSCLPGIHKSNCFSVASNKICTWFYSSTLNLLPPAFQFACLKKKKSATFFPFWRDGRYNISASLHPQHGQDILPCSKR